MPPFLQGCADGAQRDRTRCSTSSVRGGLNRPKDTAITERLEMSTTRYYELLNELIDRPEAEAHDPLVVRRLRRMRDRRRRSRAEQVHVTNEEYS
ncbi:MAG: DUF3263 domain-containing protein [Acidimicrobiales bacterium]